MVKTVSYFLDSGFWIMWIVLNPFNSGFRPGYGTETALADLVDDPRQDLDRGSATLLVLLYLSAAFCGICRT